MKNGFIKVAATTNDLKVADCHYNCDSIISIIKKCDEEQIKLVVFPELCITGYTCNDLFLQDILLNGAKDELLRIVNETSNCDLAAIVGLPLMVDSKLYNVAAFINKGKILGLVPKVNIPNYSEFYEARHFCRGAHKVRQIQIGNQMVPFGADIVFNCIQNDKFRVGIEICEDIWVAQSPSIGLTKAGATVIANLSASDENIGKDEYRRQLVKMQSAKLICGYIYSDAGEGESTTDLVFAAHNIIAENGTVLKESPLFKNEMAVSEVDVEKISNDRRKMTTYDEEYDDSYTTVNFDIGEMVTTQLTRFIDRAPFVPDDKKERDRRCNEIILIQAYGLKKRIDHTCCKSAVIGISGGLDSTLALLVTARAFDLAKIDRSNIIAVTMPCFGTTDRTYNNAVKLVESLGMTLKEINIEDAVNIHFRDIEHDSNVHDVTYENSQARERTQILMDIANQSNGMVIGTGDLSELALGWATYNGDHMSMYAVNSSVPKTLVRYLVQYFEEESDDAVLTVVLHDILNTPVSPELLPPTDGVISQKTEDLVGPYELHDFYLYNMLRYGFSPSKIYRIAKIAFEGIYDSETILKWMKIFYRRFFSQQFKRSCLPDGPKVGSIAVSPRGDLRMPSDGCVKMWLEDLEQI